MRAKDVQHIDSWGKTIVHFERVASATTTLPAAFTYSDRHVPMRTRVHPSPSSEPSLSQENFTFANDGLNTTGPELRLLLTPSRQVHFSTPTTRNYMHFQSCI